MHEASTAVIVGNDVELWSLSRTARGFSCVRTVYANSAARAYAAMSLPDMASPLSEWERSGRITDSLPLSRPTSNAGCSVTRPMAAVEFFVGERRDAELLQQAQRLVGAVAPLLEVVG